RKTSTLDTSLARRRTGARAAAQPTSVRPRQVARAVPSAARRRPKPAPARGSAAAAAAQNRKSAARAPVTSFDAEFGLGCGQQIEFDPVTGLRRILHAADAVFLHEVRRGLHMLDGEVVGVRRILDRFAEFFGRQLVLEHLLADILLRKFGFFDEGL